MSKIKLACFFLGHGVESSACVLSYRYAMLCLEPSGVRLVGGPSSNEGRLEVYYDGLWGTVCDDKFGDVDARVACFTLGYG